MRSEPFSRRQGYSGHAAEIKVREDAPAGLRKAVIQIGLEAGWNVSVLRDIICRVLREYPDEDNWSDSNISREVNWLIQKCEWYKVYDIIEAIVADSTLGSSRAPHFEREINAYFVETGIGWQLERGEILVRGSESFQSIVASASNALARSGLPTAEREIHEALVDLSRRPTPDLTGAMHHAMGSLECVMRDMCGDTKATLGELIKKYPGQIPKPLDQGIEKLWGYASEEARHIREGGQLSRDEVELVVGIAAAVSTYLAHQKNSTKGSTRIR